MGTEVAVRRYRQGDLGRLTALWDRVGLGAVVALDAAVDIITAPSSVTLVAERDDELVGVVVGAAAGAVGQLYQLAGEEPVRRRLLDEFEARLAEGGVRTVLAYAHTTDGAPPALTERGFDVMDGVRCLRRELSPALAGAGDASSLGGQWIEEGLWERLAGMDDAKEVIERRIILPLAEPERAARHGVAPPHAVVLFGPPGTGKTTFAKGVASRLRWPFLPIEIAQLAEEGGEHEPRLLARTFDRLAELPAAVVFVDEVEDIAADRREQRRVSTRVTNEFLKQIPRLRDRARHLLVCATNRVGDLDAAFLRPGRFDYVLPVGPPDAEARRAIWARYLGEITDEAVDVEALVSATEQFTPADIEFAARKAAQLAFEREVLGGDRRQATSREFLEAIQATRPTLTDDMIAAFEDDERRFARS